MTASQPRAGAAAFLTAAVLTVGSAGLFARAMRMARAIV